MLQAAKPKPTPGRAPAVGGCRWLPATIRNSYSRHSGAPLQSGTQREGSRRIGFGSRLSALKKWQRQPAKFRCSESPNLRKNRSNTDCSEFDSEFERIEVSAATIDNSYNTSIIAEEINARKKRHGME